MTQLPLGYSVFLTLLAAIVVLANEEISEEDKIFDLYKGSLEFVVTSAKGLHKAAMIGDISAIDKHPEEINTKDAHDLTPMSQAIQHFQTDFVGNICRHSHFSEDFNSSSVIFLHKLSSDPLAGLLNKKLSEVSLVLLRECKEKVSLNLVDENNNTLLHTAAKLGNITIAKLLIDDNIFNLDAKNSFGFTPLMLALDHKHPDLATYLINSGADTSLRDTDDNGVLHFAAQSGALDHLNHSKIFQGINSQNAFGATPLHECAFNCQSKSCEILLQHGADKNLRDADDKTCLEAAKEQKCLETYFLIKNYGNETFSINENGDYRFIVGLVINRTSRIQDYVDYILSQGNYSHSTGVSLYNKSNMSDLTMKTYKTLDDHFSLAQETAREWENISLLNEMAIGDIGDFGKVFLQSYKTLDRKSPGALSKLDDKKRRSLMHDFIRSKKRIIRDRGLLRKMALDYVNELEKNSSLIFLSHVKNQLGFISFHAKKNEDRASEVLIKMRSFVVKLKTDSETFFKDKQFITDLKTATNETRKEILNELLKNENISEAANRAITELGQEIDNLYRNSIVFMSLNAFTATLNALSLGGLATISFLHGRNNQKLKEQRESYKFHRKEVKTARRMQHEAAKMKGIVDKKSRGKIHATVNNMQKRVQAYKAHGLELFKERNILNKFGKAFQAMGTVAGMVSAGLEINNIVQTVQQRDDFDKHLKNLKNFTEVYHEAMINKSKLALELKMVVMTDEQRTKALSLNEICLSKLNSSIKEAEFLRDSWKNIVKSFKKMNEDVDIAIKTQDKAKRTEIIDEITYQLICLRNSWDQISQSAAEISEIIEQARKIQRSRLMSQQLNEDDETEDENETEVL